MSNPTNWRLSRYHVVSPMFFNETIGVSQRVVYATRTAQVRVIDNRAWQLLELDKANELPPEMSEELVKIEVLVTPEEDELAIILDRNRRAIQTESVLVLVVHPTAWCQLGCNYCGQTHTQKQMSVDHQEKFLHQARTKLAERPYRHLQISWFGGEPLAGLRVMRTLTPRLLSLAQLFNARYHSKIVTNGLMLTPPVATELIKECRVNHIEITLDGTAEHHDVRRHTKKGDETFDRIFANVVSLARREDVDVELSIRCNVDQRNYKSVTPLLQLLAAAQIQDQVTFYVAPIRSWGNDAHQKSLSMEEFADWEIQWYVEMLDLGFRPRVLPGLKKVVCVAVSETSEVIDANGELFACTEASYVNAYGTPNQYGIGHIETAGLQPVQRELFGKFFDRVQDGIYDCNTCRILPVCGGCCPKLWHEGIPACPVPKFNIDKRLLIQYAISHLPDAS